MENKGEIRVHRVGSITAGMSMVVFGVLFLVHSVLGTITYEMIFSLWPLMLIGLGVEMLVFNVSERKMVYDKAAVFLLLLMTVFAMGMAVADVCIQANECYMKGML